jgi:hypothetical protein
VLRSGRRGRKFESCFPDFVKPCKLMTYEAYFLHSAFPHIKSHTFFGKLAGGGLICYFVLAIY